MTTTACHPQVADRFAQTPVANAMPTSCPTDQLRMLEGASRQMTRWLCEEEAASSARREGEAKERTRNSWTQRRILESATWPLGNCNLSVMKARVCVRERTNHKKEERGKTKNQRTAVRRSPLATTPVVESSPCDKTWPFFASWIKDDADTGSCSCSAMWRLISPSVVVAGKTSSSNEWPLHVETVA